LLQRPPSKARNFTFTLNLGGARTIFE